MRFEAYSAGIARWVSDFVRLEANVDGVETSPAARWMSDFVRLEAATTDGVETSPARWVSDFVRLEANVDGVDTSPDGFVRLEEPEAEGVTIPIPDFVRLEAAEVEGVKISPDDCVRLEAAGVEGVDTSPPGLVSLEFMDVEGVDNSPPPRPPALWVLESDTLPSVAVKYPELPVAPESARDRRIDPSCHTSSSSSLALAIYPKKNLQCCFLIYHK